MSHSFDWRIQHYAYEGTISLYEKNTMGCSLYAVVSFILGKLGCCAKPEGGICILHMWADIAFWLCRAVCTCILYIELIIAHALTVSWQINILAHHCCTGSNCVQSYRNIPLPLSIFKNSKTHILKLRWDLWQEALIWYELCLNSESFSRGTQPESRGRFRCGHTSAVGSSVDLHLL